MSRILGEILPLLFRIGFFTLHNDMHVFRNISPSNLPGFQFLGNKNLLNDDWITN